MEHYLIAYAGPEALEMMDVRDLAMLTHVNLAFGIPQDGVLSLERLPNMDRVRKLQALNPRVKWILSIGGALVGGFSDLSMTEQGRERFAASVVQAMRDWNLDGVDIDWEFPCNGWSGTDARPEDKQNFTLLLQTLRRAVGEDKILSIAAGAMEQFVHDTEMDLVAQILDYVQIMTYDMRPGCYITGHHAALYPHGDDPWGDSVEQAVQRFHASGVPLDKIVIGAAFYGRHWEGGLSGQGLLQQAATMGEFGPVYRELIQMEKSGEWLVQWDEAAQAPWLQGRDALISYETPRSAALKCRYVQQKGLRGIMYWEHSYDESRALLDAMAEVLFPNHRTKETFRNREEQGL